jgi:hypothetical protein
MSQAGTFLGVDGQDPAVSKKIFPSPQGIAISLRPTGK